MRPLVWLWAPDVGAGTILTELLEKAFTVRPCRELSPVWKDLLAGQTGVFVADFTRANSAGFTAWAKLCSLSSLTPVLLLVDEPAVAHLAHTNAGTCNVLYEPFIDLDRVFAAAVELSQTYVARRHACIELRLTG